MAHNRLFSFFGKKYERILIALKRRRLKNRNFTIIGNNCCVGIMYHDLGEKFRSPTVNLAIKKSSEFLLFLENLKEFMNSDVEDISSNEISYPVGRISLSDGRTVELAFMHYMNFDEAVSKWYERRTRINYDNLFVFMEAGCETADEMVKEFCALPYKNKAIITNRKYENYPDAHYIDIYDDNYTWGKILKYKPRTLRTKRYLDAFDYVKWINGRV